MNPWATPEIHLPSFNGAIARPVNIVLHDDPAVELMVIGLTFTKHSATLTELQKHVAPEHANR